MIVTVIKKKGGEEDTNVRLRIDGERTNGARAEEEDISLRESAMEK